MSYTTASIVTPTAVATGALLLRGVARFKSKVPFGWDDAFAIAATGFFWAETGVGLWSLYQPPPGPDPASQLHRAVVSLKSLYINTLMTIAVISAAKLSILHLYKRIFNINRTFRIVVNTLLGVSYAWWIGCSLFAIFRCTPVDAAWDPLLTSNAHCASLQTGFLATETINCLTEVLLLLVPLAMIRQLQLPLRLKISVSIIFAAGFFVPATSIVRIVEAYSPSAGTEGLIKSGFWGNIQQCTGISCACLPTYRSLVPKNWDVLAAAHNLYTRLSTRANRSSSSGFRSDHSSSFNGSDRKVNQSSVYFKDTQGMTGVHEYEFTAVGEANRDSARTRNLSPNTITVERSVDIV